MADETTDTTTSPNEADPVATETQAAEQSAATDAQETEAPDAETDDGTALGGKPVEETEETAEGEGAAEEAPEGAPEKYELTFEDGEVDADLLEAADPVLRELNLTNDQANTLMPLAKQMVDKARDDTIGQITDLGAEQKADWLKIAKADDKIGGPQWNETIELAAKGMDALGFVDGHPFRTALNETGFGNHRDMLFAFRTLGGLVGEDGNFVRSDAAAPVLSAKSILYPEKKDN